LSGGATGTVTIRARATTATGAAFVRDATIALQGTASQPFVAEAWKQLLTAE
jgi:hypothetical protein